MLLFFHIIVKITLKHSQTLKTAFICFYVFSLKTRHKQNEADSNISTKHTTRIRREQIYNCSRSSCSATPELPKLAFMHDMLSQFL